MCEQSCEKWSPQFRTRSPMLWWTPKPNSMVGLVRLSVSWKGKEGNGGTEMGPIMWFWNHSMNDICDDKHYHLPWESSLHSKWKRTRKQLSRKKLGEVDRISCRYSNKLRAQHNQRISKRQKCKAFVWTGLEDDWSVTYEPLEKWV
jgi:hypothetical protein